MQTTSNILMIRPAKFMYNAQTAVNNSFQQASAENGVQEKALHEFDSFVQTLQANQIHVTVVQDTDEPSTPDSIFPNNWISFHENGEVFLYPMFAENRRLERKEHVLAAINEKFYVDTITDLTYFEQQHKFLEGTGSMVLDREFRIAYACLSPRTNIEVLNEWCTKNNYKVVTFHAKDINGNAIYHTNVMMCVADRYAVVCTDCIPLEAERKSLLQSLSVTHKHVVHITVEQMNHFAGNMLQVENIDGKQFLVMSSQAFASLTIAQRNSLEKFNPVIHSTLSTIEKNGGGSARCMMAEIFLAEKN